MSKYKRYFKISPNGLLATCSINKCNAIIKCPNRTTSGLKYHVEEKHKINMNEEEPDEKRAKSSIMSNFVQVKKPPVEELLSREACQGKILA